MRTMKSIYAKRCLKCEKPIMQTNQSGYCSGCKNKMISESRRKNA
jgi:hypothetical protein